MKNIIALNNNIINLTLKNENNAVSEPVKRMFEDIYSVTFFIRSVYAFLFGTAKCRRRFQHEP